jgi:BirA family transcriptional regulator, biotin operon repressor / biotin---[acetyl-CoA-carboxylase] ligase
MELSADLTATALARLLPDRPLRVYPALLSTEADALAWARAGAPDGAVVAAGYQASPRGRAGLEWRVDPERSLAFSMVLRPRLPPHREGWLYVVAASGLADVVGAAAEIAWPDEVHVGERIGAVAVQTGLGPATVEWAVVSLLVEAVTAPRVELLARLVEGLERRRAEPTAEVLADYLRRCRTIGRVVRARLIPMGPGGTEIVGTAVTVRPDGALVLETEEERRLAVPPQSLGLLEIAS